MALTLTSSLKYCIKLHTASNFFCMVCLNEIRLFLFIYKHVLRKCSIYLYNASDASFEIYVMLFFSYYGGMTMLYDADIRSPWCTGEALCLGAWDEVVSLKAWMQRPSVKFGSHGTVSFLKSLVTSWNAHKVMLLLCYTMWMSAVYKSNFKQTLKIPTFLYPDPYHTEMSSLHFCSDSM